MDDDPRYAAIARMKEIKECEQSIKRRKAQRKHDIMVLVIVFLSMLTGLIVSFLDIKI